MLDDMLGGAASRHIHRLREISIRKMAEGAAQDRLTRAESSQTRPAGEFEGLKIGDMVDFVAILLIKMLPAGADLRP